MAILAYRPKYKSYSGGDTDDMIGNILVNPTITDGLELVPLPDTNTYYVVGYTNITDNTNNNEVVNNPNLSDKSLVFELTTNITIESLEALPWWGDPDLAAAWCASRPYPNTNQYQFYDEGGNPTIVVSYGLYYPYSLIQNDTYLLVKIFDISGQVINLGVAFPPTQVPGLSLPTFANVFEYEINYLSPRVGGGSAGIQFWGSSIDYGSAGFINLANYLDSQYGIIGKDRGDSGSIGFELIQNGFYHTFPYVYLSNLRQFETYVGVKDLLQVLMDGRNLQNDINVSITGPFEVQTDGAASNSVTITPIDGKISPKFQEFSIIFSPQDVGEATGTLTFEMPWGDYVLELLGNGFAVDNSVYVMSGYLISPDTGGVEITIVKTTGEQTTWTKIYSGDPPAQNNGVFLATSDSGERIGGTINTGTFTASITIKVGAVTTQLASVTGIVTGQNLLISDTGQTIVSSSPSW